MRDGVVRRCFTSLGDHHFVTLRALQAFLYSSTRYIVEACNGAVQSVLSAYLRLFTLSAYLLCQPIYSVSLFTLSAYLQAVRFIIFEPYRSPVATLRSYS